MRIKSGVTTRAHKKKKFKLAKGFYSNKRNRWRMVIQQVDKSLTAAYVGRKDRKGDFRSLWIERINAACREQGTSYGKFIAGLKKSGITAAKSAIIWFNVYIINCGSCPNFNSSWMIPSTISKTLISC